jgi:hypothetical protein
VSELDDLVARMASVNAEPYTFTLHLNFAARDEDQAALRAVQYAEALNLLRPEVDSYRARVSAQADWPASVPLFCNSPGPSAADCCVYRFGHEGRHHGPGPSRVWTDDEVPTAPDDPGDLTP